jgi:hypothetical protein
MEGVHLQQILQSKYALRFSIQMMRKKDKSSKAGPGQMEDSEKSGGAERFAVEIVG